MVKLSLIDGVVCAGYLLLVFGLALKIAGGHARALRRIAEILGVPAAIVTPHEE